MIHSDKSVHALQRFGLGARPGDLDRVQRDPVGALQAEINRPRVTLLSKPGLLSTSEALKVADEYQVERRKRLAAEPNLAGDAAAMSASPRRDKGIMDDQQSGTVSSREIYLDEVVARYEAAQKAECGFAERLVWFWSNHFAISAAKGARLLVTAGAFEREAIRPHVFGRFADMLLAVEQHPSMIMFLDNNISIGPNSAAGSRRGRGLNENLAREILELHTLGVNGGYNQADVLALAKIITGWTIGEKQDGSRGAFTFNPHRHEPGVHKVLARSYAQAGVQQGQAVLADLARHPSTARFIATKLVRHFVGDEPPADLVAHLAKTFEATDGNLAKVSRALIEAPAAWEPPPTKLRSPQELLAAMLRATNSSLEGPQLVRLLMTLGQRPWSPGGPDGFPDTAAYWTSASGMRTRLDVASVIAQRAEANSDPATLVDQIIGPIASRETRSAIAAADSRAQGLAILFAAPEFQRR
ncbi:MAG TPA: DUF1800 family protein [Xanthobacteraceae bacterium]|nr:DUF1800 family protein [Xanthobacteraceae bacterium]